MLQYFVRQPIKDLNENIVGYEILFNTEGGSSLYNNGDDRAAADAIVNFMMQKSDSFFDNKIAFLTFTPNLLFRNIPKIFEKNRLVIQIDDNVIIHPLTHNFLVRFREQGYHIAFNDFQFAPRYFAIMDMIDYVRLDFSQDLSPYENVVTMARNFNKKVIAYKVDTQEAYNVAMELQVDYFQGTYIHEVVSDTTVQMDFLKSNFFQLVAEITKDEPDLNVVEAIISRDVSLTYGLLKMVNSAYYALRNKASSIMQALVIMGLGQVKQWIYLLTFQQDGNSLPEDLVKTSLLRANFCSELVPYIGGLPISKSEAYLMGMFSTLGIIMQVPLEVALAELPVPDIIKNAILNKEGVCGLLYELVLTYEQADWAKITAIADELGMPQDALSRVYFECVENVNQIWSLLQS